MCGFIGHPRKQLKARACYLLLRMCRSVGASLGPYAGTLLAGLQPLLLIPSLVASSFPPAIQAMLATCAAELGASDAGAAQRERDAVAQIEEALTAHDGLMHHGLAFDDQLQLYELVGTIIWSPWMDLAPDQQQRCTAAVVNPIFGAVEAHAARAAAEPLLPGICIGRCVSALCSFSKGLGTREASSDVAVALFVTVLERVQAALAAMPADAQLRRRAITLLHRMTVSLGERLITLPSLPTLMSFLVLTRARGPPSVVALDTISTTQLLSQLISKFCAKLAPLVDEMFAPVMQMVSYVQTSVAETLDAKLLRKLYFQLLHNLMSSELSGVLLSARNVQHLPAVLESIVHGCLETERVDRDVSKLCFTLMSALTKAWFPPASDVSAKGAAALAAVPAMQQETRDAVARFLWEKGTDAAFRSPLREGLDITDAGGSALLREVSYFVRGLHRAFGARCVGGVSHLSWSAPPPRSLPSQLTLNSALLSLPTLATPKDTPSFSSLSTSLRCSALRRWRTSTAFTWSRTTSRRSIATCGRLRGARRRRRGGDDARCALRFAWVSITATSGGDATLRLEYIMYPICKKICVLHAGASERQRSLVCYVWNLVFYCGAGDGGGVTFFPQL
jgi:hypothetical protein